MRILIPPVPLPSTSQLPSDVIDLQCSLPADVLLSSFEYVTSELRRTSAGRLFAMLPAQKVMAGCDQWERVLFL